MPVFGCAEFQTEAAILLTADCSPGSLSLNLFSYVIYDVIKILLGAEFDVLAIFVAPCSVPRRRAPHVTHAGNLLASVLITEMERAFQDIAPVRALTQIIGQAFQDRGKV